MHEAGDSLFAINAKPPTDADAKVIAGIRTCSPWAAVVDASARLEKVEDVGNDQVGLPRIIFPVVLPIHVEKKRWVRARRWSRGTST